MLMTCRKGEARALELDAKLHPLRRTGRCGEAPRRSRGAAHGRNKGLRGTRLEWWMRASTASGCANLRMQICVAALAAGRLWPRCAAAHRGQLRHGARTGQAGMKAEPLKRAQSDLRA